MSDLCITVAAYGDLTNAQTDWTVVEAAADANSIYISDADILERDPGGRVENIHGSLITDGQGSGGGSRVGAGCFLPRSSAAPWPEVSAAGPSPA
jgi:hypothetical protein